jgi:hypothetical protein
LDDTASTERSLPVRKFPLGVVPIVIIASAVANPGCENMNGDPNKGAVVDRNQQQQTSADGNTQVRERTQVRQTPDGQTIRETETQKREVVPAGTDASQ